MYEVVFNHSRCWLELFPWIDSGLVDVKFLLRFDELTSLMLVVITSISFCAHMYSIAYMDGDPHQARFMSYLSLFTWFMFILVTSSNFLQLFLGWEGVGVCSFLLINFWYTRLQANKSAIKAMLVNKISDIFLTIGIFLIFFEFKSLNYDIVFCIIGNDSSHDYTIDLICFFLLVGAIGKSAQILLHIWLPDAMEGPTPVSSLIHAATMVTAGIFLIIRCSYIFEYANTILFIIICLGALTAFFSSTTGFFQNDIKKVIAYSTCSQLGYMFFVCGFSHYHISFFHLFNHAFFKALLFLTAGCLIHSINNVQDIRQMGGFLKVFPFAYICLLIGSISLMGFPFMTGFYSKDLIIESTYNTINSGNFYIINTIHSMYWLLVISIIFTALYSLRVLIIVFIKHYMGPLDILRNIHYSNFYIIVPLVYLSLLSIFIGYYSKDLIIGIGTDTWDFSGYNIFTFYDFEFYTTFYKMIPLILSIYSMICSVFIYAFFNMTFDYFKLEYFYYKIFIFFNQKWYFDKLINSYFIKSILKTSYKSFFHLFDKGVLELFGPYGISLSLQKVSKRLDALRSGLLYHYIGIALNVVSYLLILIVLLMLSNY